MDANVHHVLFGDRRIEIVDVDAQREIIDVDSIPEEKMSAGRVEELESVPPTDLTQNGASVPVPANKSAETEEERKKQRARLRRMLQPDRKPSFVAIISSGDGDRPESPLRINVDEYLGLTAQKPPPSAAATESTKRHADVKAEPLLPADEGWYEGVVPLALTDEARYLNEFHFFVRSQLELFSATQEDVETSMPGRRTPTIRGKVGIRCIHCSKNVQETKSLPSGNKWPAGAVSYPLSIAGLYAICSQKPVLHFEKCPNMSMELKAQLYRLTHDQNGNPTKRQRKVADSDSRSISTNLYYTAAAKRLGMVDVKGGIRFGRDLSLEPLPMETVLAQLDESSNRVRSLGATLGEVPSGEPRITADEESERVLAKAVAEKDDEKNLLGRSQDKNMVTDYMFLSIRQMAICHAVPSDFDMRGKRSKLMRVGFAGFCCRHCSNASQNEISSMLPLMYPTGRCFTSAADSLASTISNTFNTHLEKCYDAPSELKRALAAYKKLHPRQIRQLPHGSQRRMFQILWERIRASDVSEEEMKEKLKNVPIPAVQRVPRVKLEDGCSGDPLYSSDSLVPDAVGSAAHDESTWVRPASFPDSTDEETIAVLQRAENEGYPSSGDQLLLPSDRNMISDFVFLMMKQLKVAYPAAIDYGKGPRRSSVCSSSQPGLRCKHCMGQDPRFCVTGRSFPSQPDNIATTLNTSLYVHLQKCSFVPEDIRHALANLKKIHSAQRSCLRFGAQRRFFNLLFDRLCAAAAAAKRHNAGEDAEDLTLPASEESLQRYGFVRTIRDAFECQHCRRVPFSLRARSSFFLGRPSVDFARSHKEICAGESFDLSLAADVLSEAVAACPDIMVEDKMTPLFQNLILVLVGDNDALFQVFTKHIVQVMKSRKNQEGDNLSEKLKEQSQGLWRDLAVMVKFDTLAQSFELFASSTAGRLLPHLLEHKELLRFFRVICPSLVTPDPVSTNCVGDVGDEMVDNEVGSSEPPVTSDI